jgi:hypothetical protein
MNKTEKCRVCGKHMTVKITSYETNLHRCEEKTHYNYSSEDGYTNGCIMIIYIRKKEEISGMKSMTK